MPDSVLPGDTLATIEEYAAGNNAYDDGEMIRSTIVGESDIIKNERIVNVKNQELRKFPEPDDIIIGTVEAVMGSMIAVLIMFINSKPVKSHVECICSTRNIRTLIIRNSVPASCLTEKMIDVLLFLFLSLFPLANIRNLV